MDSRMDPQDITGVETPPPKKKVCFLLANLYVEKLVSRSRVGLP